MSLIVFENGQLKLADTTPISRSKLLADAKFCQLVAEIMAYINGKTWDRSDGEDHRRFFYNDQVAHQFNTALQEKTESDEPFSINDWYASIVENNNSTSIDWMSHLIDEELRTDGAFVGPLKNCIDMEERVKHGNFERMRAFVRNGGARDGDLDIPSSFFSNGGISAPLRFRK